MAIAIGGKRRQRSRRAAGIDGNRFAAGGHDKPEAIAAQAIHMGIVLRDGGSAIEAMVAAAATIAVVYPHMNGLGGDGFWLIVPPGGEPIAIDASGAAGSLATRGAR